MHRSSGGDAIPVRACLAAAALSLAHASSPEVTDHELKPCGRCFMRMRRGVCVKKDELPEAITPCLRHAQSS